MTFTFTVTFDACGFSGDCDVELEISELEEKRLRSCAAEYEEMTEYPGLKRLSRHIIHLAWEMSMEENDLRPTDLAEMEATIQIPEVFYKN